MPRAARQAITTFLKRDVRRIMQTGFQRIIALLRDIREPGDTVVQYEQPIAEFIIEGMRDTGDVRAYSLTNSSAAAVASSLAQAGYRVEVRQWRRIQRHWVLVLELDSRHD